MNVEVQRKRGMINRMWWRPLAAAVVNSSTLAAVTSSLLMVVVEEASDLLLHGSEGVLSNLTLWYVDTRATNHMSKCRNFFYSLDESLSGFVKFEDNLKIKIEGCGDIEVS